MVDLDKSDGWVGQVGQVEGRWVDLVWKCFGPNYEAEFMIMNQ